jgi:hypothetical protein
MTDGKHMQGNPLVAAQAIDAAQHALRESMRLLSAGDLANANLKLMDARDYAEGAREGVIALAVLNEVKL